MRKILFGAIIILMLLAANITFAFAAPDTSKASGTNSYLNSLTDLFKGFFSSSTKLAEQSADPYKGSESLFWNINNWFRETTGIGLDQIFLAFWRLFIWILKSIFGLIWNIAAWLLSLIGFRA